MYKKDVYSKLNGCGNLQQYMYIPCLSQSTWYTHTYTHTLTHRCVTHDVRVSVPDTLGIVRTLSITHLVYCGMYINIFPRTCTFIIFNKFIASEAHSLCVFLIQPVMSQAWEIHVQSKLVFIVDSISMLTIKIQHTIIIYTTKSTCTHKCKE